MSERVMRAKMQVQSVKEVKPWPGTNMDPTEELELSAVCGHFDSNGDGEDNTYARFTPQARLTMTINNPDLLGKVEPGQKFYLDFILAEE